MIAYFIFILYNLAAYQLKRYDEYIYHRVQVTTVEQVKREEELSWKQVQGIFNHQRKQVKKPHEERLNV
jgi:hypothetical protein